MKTPLGFSLPSLTELTGKDSEKNRLTARRASGSASAEAGYFSGLVGLFCQKLE